MATIAAVNVVLDAKTGAFNRKMSQAQGTMSKMANSAKNLGRVYQLAIAAGAVMATKATFQLASSVEETGSKFRTVFGDSADAVDEFIDSFGVLAGLSDTQARGIISTTGAIAQGMGFAQDASAKFSAEIVTLAGDMASFNNVPIEQTSRAITSALTGERESLKTLGIVINQAEVDARALAIAQANGAETATAQHKAMATLELVTQRAGSAVGDLERTQDSAANRARALTAEIQNMKEAMAQALLPIFAAVLRGGLHLFNQLKLGYMRFKAQWAEWPVFWHGLPFLGDPDSLQPAQENLARLQGEFDEFFAHVQEGAERSIDMSMFGEGGAGGGGGGAAGVIKAVGDASEEAATKIKPLIKAVADTSVNFKMIGPPAEGLLDTTYDFIPAFNQAAFEAQATGLAIELMGDKADKASSAFSKLSQAMRFLGGVANIFSLSGTISNFFSKAGSILSMGDTLSAAGVFGSGQKAEFSNPKMPRFMDEPTAPVVVNINGPGLETLVDTITVQQGRSRELRRVRRV